MKDKTIKAAINIAINLLPENLERSEISSVELLEADRELAAMQDRIKALEAENAGIADVKAVLKDLIPLCPADDYNIDYAVSSEDYERLLKAVAVWGIGE